MLPIKLLRTIAYLRNLESSHPTYSNLSQDFKRSVAGLQGEKAISYYLYPIIEKDYRVFYNVRLFINGQYFEIDVLLISRSFILIIEVKNLKGRIMFDHKSGGMIQTKDGDTQTYQDPVIQISRQEILLSKWLKERSIKIPIKSVVCFVNRHATIERDEYTDSRIIYGYKLPLVYERYQNEFKSHPQAISENFLYNILTRENQPLDIKLMNKYGLNKQDFKPGLSCIHCSKKGLVRVRNVWICKNCSHEDADGALHALKDYFLIYGSIINNEMARHWLQETDRKYVTRVLERTGSKIGEGKGASYVLDFDYEKDYKHYDQFIK